MSTAGSGPTGTASARRGITALLGSGFDPGVTGVFSAYALKHHFDEIHYIDILDCNGGDHGYPFATNFNRRSTSGKYPPTFLLGGRTLGGDEAHGDQESL